MCCKEPVAPPGPLARILCSVCSGPPRYRWLTMSGELAGREPAREVPALSGVSLKIDRARAHLADFDAHVGPLEAECMNAIVRDRDERKSQYVFRFDHV